MWQGNGINIDAHVCCSMLFCTSFGEDFGRPRLSNTWLQSSAQSDLWGHFEGSDRRGPPYLLDAKRQERMMMMMMMMQRLFDVVELARRYLKITCVAVGHSAPQSQTFTCIELTPSWKPKLYEPWLGTAPKNSARQGGSNQLRHLNLKWTYSPRSVLTCAVESRV